MRPVQSVSNEEYVNYSLDGANDCIFVPLGVCQISVRSFRSDIYQAVEIGLVMNQKLLRTESSSEPLLLLRTESSFTIVL